MRTSTNYSFKRPQLTDSATIEDVSDSIESIDNTIKSVSDQNLVQTASGTANAIVLSLPTTLVNGYQVTFVASANNSGSATIINSTYQLYKPATTTTPTLIKDKPYSIYYNSTGNCFFLKASSEGDALASHVLAGKKFSNDDDIGLTGTLDLSLLTSANIRSGITINGISGNSNVVNTSDAVLDTQYLLTGYSGYDDGVKKNGTMANRGAVVITPSTSNQAIPKGFHNGSGYVVGDTDLRASNIVNTANIFGVQGTATVESLGGTKYATGTLTPTYDSDGYGSFFYANIPTLSFTPRVIVVYGTFTATLNSSFDGSTFTSSIKASCFYLSNIGYNFYHTSETDNNDYFNGVDTAPSLTQLRILQPGYYCRGASGTVAWYAYE